MGQDQPSGKDLPRGIKAMLCMQEGASIHPTPLRGCFSPVPPMAELVPAPFNQNKWQINLT